LSIPSHKSTPEKGRVSQEPQRSNGKARVSAILQAAAAVLDEKGYDLTTVAEIAERSDTKIGSLYRFFPNKESIADALIVHARENIDLVFDKFDITVESLSITELSDNLLDLIFELFTRPALMALLDTGKQWTVKREEFRAAMLSRISKALLLHSPKLSQMLANDVAVIVLHNAKTVVLHRPSAGTTSNLKAEIQQMNRLYLASKLEKRE
jgi:AcrR family transcriptional regulator